MMKKNRIKKPFTLIEMIAVVAIAATLIAIFVPAFNSMMFGSKVDQAASSFRLGLEMAQAQAISSRRYVAMVVPQYFGAAEKKLQPYCDGGYRLAFTDKAGHFYGWVPGSYWRNAADGARFSGKVSDLKTLSLDTTLADGGSKDADWEALGSDNRTGVIFSPYGGVVGDTVLNFSFTEASYDGIDSETKRAKYKYPNPDNEIVLRLNYVTGRVKYDNPED